MQVLIDLFCSYKAFSLDKTLIASQPAPDSPTIFVDGYKVKMVDKFTYLGHTIDTAHLYREISAHVKKSTDVFTDLKD